MQNEPRKAPIVAKPDTVQKYTVNLGDKTVELTLDELLLTAKCVLMKQAKPVKGSGDTNADFLRFVEKYPQVREFPKEVEQQIVLGATPLDAYREYEIAQLKAKLSALENNAGNELRSTGSSQGDASDDELSELQAAFEAMFRR